MMPRRRLLPRPLILLVALAAGVLLSAEPMAAVRVAGSRCRCRPMRMASLLDELPDEPLVLVGFDPDLGTYAEIRPTVRTLLADLLARGARLAIISLTPEGRALALAEQSRLDASEVGPASGLDLGFVPGAEAALVGSWHAPRRSGDALGPPSDAVDLGGVDLDLIVGGNDLGPRSWVEQVEPRIGDVPMAAITPTILLPEVEPYELSGQLRGGALDAARRRHVSGGSRAGPDRGLGRRRRTGTDGNRRRPGVRDRLARRGARRAPVREALAAPGGRIVVSGLLGSPDADQIATLVAALVTLIVLGGLLRREAAASDGRSTSSPDWSPATSSCWPSPRSSCPRLVDPLDR